MCKFDGVSSMWQILFLHAEVHSIANTVFVKHAMHPVLEIFTGDLFWEASGNSVIDFRRTVVVFYVRKNLFSLENYFGNSDFYSLSPFPSSSLEKQPPNVNLLFPFSSVLT